MSDLSVAYKDVRDWIEGKKELDPEPLKKLVRDALDELARAKSAVEGLSAAYQKDVAPLMDDSLASVADIAKLAASPLSVANIGADIANALALVRQLAKDVADVKQAVADFKAGQKDG